MKIGTFNARSLVNKTVGVMEHLLEMDCDICFMQETFLRDGDNAKLVEIKDYGWNILSDPRKYRTGGGIAMLYKSSITLKSNTKVTKYKSFQVMESLLKADTEMVRLVNVYKPGYTKKARYTDCMFLEEFEDYLKTLSNKTGTPLIAGDFNFHVERPGDRYPKMFLDLLNNNQLQQYVPLIPTHEDGGTLDLVITNKNFGTRLGTFDVIKSRTTSDHFLVLFEVDISDNSLKDEGKFLNYRNFKSIDIECFKEDILNSDLRNFEDSLSVDEAVLLYDSVLTKLIDKHSPVIRKKLIKKATPWLDVELRTLRRKRRAAERAWRSGKGGRLDYIRIRDEFTRLEFIKRCKHHKESLRTSSGDTKTLYKKLHRLLGSDSQDLPKHQNSTRLSEEFKDHFAEKVNKIRRDISDGDGARCAEKVIDETNDPAINCKIDDLTTITAEDLKDLVCKMSNKFCCLDPIPTFLLKQCISELTPILLHIINTSLTTGMFPSGMKKAVIKPTLKKDNIDADNLNNYRPVSNLPTVSKLLEKVVLNQLNDYLTSNNLHCPVQSGYRPHHSCETLLVRMADDINKEIEEGNIVIVVLLDLSAAFDTIDHNILLDKLLKDYGICGKALHWVKSYLHGRSFCVKIDDTMSSLLELLFGVPQGSLLGPILFILYIKALQKIASKYGLDIQLYADDSQLYISFCPSQADDITAVKSRINNCLAEIKSWMILNFMKLNESKTELLVLGKTRVLKECNLDVRIQFGNMNIMPTECKGDNWKSLGIRFDESLSMERQINSVKKKCSWTMMNLRTIGHYLDEGVKIMLVKQLVIAKLDYCNSLYTNLPKTRLNKLRSILNGAVRYIYNIKDRTENLIPYYKKAHILPIDQRIVFKVCLLAHKVVYGLCPTYLSSLVERDMAVSSIYTRAKPQGDCLRLKVPKMSRTKLGERRFSNYAPTYWNALPLQIRSLVDTSGFKRKLKNHLYNMF